MLDYNMKTPKTVILIECRKCGGSYFGGDQKIVLSPGSEKELPDEIAIIVRKIAICMSCKQYEDRTRGGQKTRFSR